jgi:hypothetical protein
MYYRSYVRAGILPGRYFPSPEPFFFFDVSNALEPNVQLATYQPIEG